MTQLRISLPYPFYLEIFVEEAGRWESIGRLDRHFMPESFSQSDLLVIAQQCAAAPELLDALQNTQFLLTHLYNSTSGHSVEIGAQAEQNEAAIQKATGRQPND